MELFLKARRVLIRKRVLPHDVTIITRGKLRTMDRLVMPLTVLRDVNDKKSKPW